MRFRKYNMRSLRKILDENVIASLSADKAGTAKQSANQKQIASVASLPRNDDSTFRSKLKS
jgi:hypothetical protein